MSMTIIVWLCYPVPPWSLEINSWACASTTGVWKFVNYLYFESEEIISDLPAEVLGSTLSFWVEILAQDSVLTLALGLASLSAFFSLCSLSPVAPGLCHRPELLDYSVGWARPCRGPPVSDLPLFLGHWFLTNREVSCQIFRRWVKLLSMLTRLSPSTWNVSRKSTKGRLLGGGRHLTFKSISATQLLVFSFPVLLKMFLIFLTFSLCHITHYFWMLGCIDLN